MKMADIIEQKINHQRCSVCFDCLQIQLFKLHFILKPYTTYNHFLKIKLLMLLFLKIIKGYKMDSH